MPNNKKYRINDDIRFALSQLLRSVKDPRVQNAGMLSITRTDTTGDLRYCKVYISAYGCENEKELMKGLKSVAPWLRHELMSSLDLRYTPELIFELDKSLEKGAYMNTLITNTIREDERKESEAGHNDAE